MVILVFWALGCPHRCCMHRAAAHPLPWDNWLNGLRDGIHDELHIFNLNSTYIFRFGTHHAVSVQAK